MQNTGNFNEFCVFSANTTYHLRGQIIKKRKNRNSIQLSTTFEIKTLVNAVLQARVDNFVKFKT